jgi:hypothetical protein
MTDRALSFPAPEKPLRGASRDDRAALAARQRRTIRDLASQWLGGLGPVAGGTAGSPRSAQIGHVLPSRHQAVATVTATQVASGHARTQRRRRSGSARIVARTLRRGIHERWTPLMCLAIVFVDQATKAVRPGGAFVVNTGGAAVLPAPLASMLWKSQTFGAVCDTADAVLVLVGLRVAHRLTHRSQRVAATGVLAGLLSNLLDRLGTSSLFHVGLPRGCIDWIAIPAWPAARSNIADIVIAAGILAFTCHPVRHAIRALRTLIRRSRFARLAAVGTGLVAVAIWTTFWQANRHAAELQTTTRSETAARCTVITYPSDGMDWLSYRPKAGPVPYHAGADAPGSPRSIAETAGVACRATH